MKTPEADVAEMIRRAHAGESEILGQLLARCERRLRLRTHHQIGPALAVRCDGGDIMQQSLMDAVRCFDDFRGRTEAELLAWLERIIQHNLTDVIRGHFGAQKRSVEGESRVSHHLELVSPGSSPTHRLARREDALRLERAIATLPQDQGQAVRLRHLDGHSLQEIAGRMGRTPVAVASLIKRGMRRLRDVLENEGAR